MVGDAEKLVFDVNPNQTWIETVSCNTKVGRGVLSHGRTNRHSVVAIEEYFQVWDCRWRSLCVSISLSGTRLVVSLA